MREHADRRDFRDEVFRSLVSMRTDDRVNLVAI
jgi:hypothetical protein